MAVLPGEPMGPAGQALVGVGVVRVRLVGLLRLVDVEALDPQPVGDCGIGLDQPVGLGVVRLEPVVDGAGHIAVFGLAAFGLDDAGDRDDVVLLRRIGDALRLELIQGGGDELLQDVLGRGAQREPVLAGGEEALQVLGLGRQAELGRASR